MTSSVTLLSILQHNVVSSAYITILNKLLTKGKLFMYIRKSSDPNTEPEEPQYQ